MLRFLIQVTKARDGVLLVRRFRAERQPPETLQVFDADGRQIDGPLAPFARSVAGTAVSMQEACVMNDLNQGGAVELQPFEKQHHSLLAAPLNVGPGIQAVIELFDKSEGPFTPADQRLVQAGAEVGGELLRQALGERQEQQLLFNAVEAALRASEQVSAALPRQHDARREAPPPQQVLDQLRQGLSLSSRDAAHAEQSLALAEAIRVLALKHGPAALDHCLGLVKNVQALLDRAVGGAPL